VAAFELIFRVGAAASAEPATDRPAREIPPAPTARRAFRRDSPVKVGHRPVGARFWLDSWSIIPINVVERRDFRTLAWNGRGTR